MFTGGVAYAMGVPEAEKDWDRSSPTNFVQKIDQGTGLKVWTQVVADPGAAVQRRIKILCDDEPVLPSDGGDAVRRGRVRGDDRSAVDESTAAASRARHGAAAAASSCRSGPAAYAPSASLVVHGKRRHTEPGNAAA